MISTRAITRVILAAFVLSMGLALAGCEDTKLMEMFDGKKKLPGERKEVFPGGQVPGVQAGVPPELMKGYQPPVEQNPPGRRYAAGRRAGCAGAARAGETRAAAEAQARCQSQAQATAGGGVRAGATASAAATAGTTADPAGWSAAAAVRAAPGLARRDAGGTAVGSFFTLTAAGACRRFPPIASGMTAFDPCVMPRLFLIHPRSTGCRFCAKEV